MASSVLHAASVNHLFGTTTVDTPPKRVAVIGVGALDALDYFAITPIAVSHGTTYPKYLEKYNGDKFASTGSLFEPDFEAIYTLKPDLIVVGARGSKFYKELQEIAPTLVFTLDDKKSYWESTQQQWRNLGTLFNIESQVEQTIADFDVQIEKIKQHNQANEHDALTVMSSGGNVTTFGAHSRFSVIYTDFAFKESVHDIKDSRHGDLVSYEFIRDAKPSTLFVVDRDKLVNKGKSNTRAAFDNDLVKATPAYKNDRVIFLDINAWYLAIAGVNATQQMIDDIAQ
ncbi:siderophore ABC transporter substrate-binding protein [Vibrio sp. MA40-2]|uniref:siderophore ABC transporter substrate-binding protein n=1 Tax=Vibrio sp. MA40-2 TaxID=3391828 RepID=UPI0039A64799